MTVVYIGNDSLIYILTPVYQLQMYEIHTVLRSTKSPLVFFDIVFIDSHVNVDKYRSDIRSLSSSYRNVTGSGRDEWR